jgi:hypothetical protein
MALHAETSPSMPGTELWPSPESDVEQEIMELTRHLAKAPESTPAGLRAWPERRARAQTPASIAVIALFLASGLTALTLTGHSPIGHRAAPSSFAVERANAERLAAVAVQRVEEYIASHSSPPASLAEVGLTVADGASIEIVGDRLFRITARQGGERITVERPIHSQGGRR